MKYQLRKLTIFKNITTKNIPNEYIIHLITLTMPTIKANTRSIRILFSTKNNNYGVYFL